VRKDLSYLLLSVSLASQASEMMSIRELKIWVAEHLQADVSVEDLADRMSMSVRNFERVFTREVGTTPSRYVLQMRVEAAPSSSNARREASSRSPRPLDSATSTS
jgi:transcriptional regulator GlxA family with amidase domain